MYELTIKLINILFVAAIIFSTLYAQPTNLKLDKIGLEQGLSQSTVYAITQDEQGFMWFGTDDGLNRYDGYAIKVFKHSSNNLNSVADNTILALFSDTNGDLWIGTRRGGVDRYDITRNKFYHYFHVADNTSTISDNSISTLFKDSQGNLWVGTRKGLNRYNYSDSTFSRFNLHPNDNSNTDALSVTSICEDSSKTLWIGTSVGLFKINSNYLNRKKADSEIYYSESTVFLSGLYVRTVYIDHAGVLWAGTFGKGLYRYSHEVKKFTSFTDNSNSVSSKNLGNFIFRIYEDSKDNFWVAAYDSGLSVYNRNNGKFQRWMNEPVHAIYVDNSDIIWFGTYTDGVKTYDARKNRFNPYYDRSSSVFEKDNNLITSILQDSKGYLWVGTYSKGLKLYSPLDRSDASIRKKIKQFEFENGNPYSISSNRVICLCESSDGNIWIGTEIDGLNMYDYKTKKFIKYRNNPRDKNSPVSDRVTALYFDKEKDLLWIGYLDGSVDSYNYKTRFFKHYQIEMKNNHSTSINSVTAIYNGKQTGLWVGSFEGDLNRFIPESDSFKQFRISYDSSADINRNGIYSMFEDMEGIFWIGTYGGGLKRLDVKSKSIKTYTDQNGLPNNVVYSILPDKADNIWLSTNKGIVKFNPVKETFRNYNVMDGVQSNEFNQGAYYINQSGELFFGGVNGFNAFFPEEIVDNTFIPPVYITTIKVFDEVLPLPDPLGKNIEQIELTYAQNFISFEFVALNFTSAEKNKYAYKLDGFDKDWHTVSANQRYASYTNLNPGTYILRVKASNNDNVWNERGTSITIIVTPPFWMTWWFRGLIIITIMIIGGSIIRYFVLKNIKDRTRKMEKEASLERERLRIARDMHDDLGARLTEIRFLSEMAQNNPAESANKVFQQVSEASKEIISKFNEIVWSVNPENDTVENLAEFIGQFSVDFLSKMKIKCRLDLPDELPDWRVSSEIRHDILLAVKETLNNSVKYSNTDEVNVKISAENSTLKVIIRDFGKGFDIDNIHKLGNGLNNMKKRMEKFSGKCEIESKLNLGTKVTFTIPLIKED
ncbi:MAG TPA: hypothetical protein DHV28_05865 [Ignavibacteriales bacterium]|nr:hypothetical protein [Ignavibacteriales bacterium]